MRWLRHSALALALFGCGSGSPPRLAEPAAVAVAKLDDGDQDTDEPGVVAMPGRAEDRQARTLSACVLELRENPGLASPAEATETYVAALSAERRGDLSVARRAYFDLVQRSPQSPYIPLVYLAFAELFARDAMSDSHKWDLAKSAYREVAKYPPPINRAHSYALLRLGEIELLQAEFSQSLSSFVKVAEAVRNQPEQACSRELEVPARRGAINAFAQAGAPDKAWALFSRYAGDQSELWLTELADAYVGLGKTADACAALRSAGSAPGAAIERARQRVCP
jgi:hypothetical protein